MGQLPLPVTPALQCPFLLLSQMLLGGWLCFATLPFPSEPSPLQLWLPALPVTPLAKAPETPAESWTTPEAPAHGLHLEGYFPVAPGHHTFLVFLSFAPLLQSAWSFLLCLSLNDIPWDVIRNLSSQSTPSPRTAAPSPELGLRLHPANCLASLWLTCSSYSQLKWTSVRSDAQIPNLGIILNSFSFLEIRSNSQEKRHKEVREVCREKKIKGPSDPGCVSLGNRRFQGRQLRNPTTDVRKGTVFLSSEHNKMLAEQDCKFKPVCSDTKRH